MVTEIDPTAAFIAPIILKDRLEIIFKFPQQPLGHRALDLTQTEVESTINRLQNNLIRPDRTEEVQADAQKLYDWLIKPLETELERLSKNDQVKTLVFVLDGSLRNIPMSVLYNQGQYLIEQYGVAVIPSRQLFDAGVRQSSFKVLSAGVSEAQTVAGIEFSELPYVPKELNRIQQITHSVEDSLLNQTFTRETLSQQIDSAAFPVVHLATHGEFSSEPRRDLFVGLGRTTQSPRFLSTASSQPFWWLSGTRASDPQCLSNGSRESTSGLGASRDSGSGECANNCCNLVAGR